MLLLSFIHRSIDSSISFVFKFELEIGTEIGIYKFLYLLFFVINDWLDLSCLMLREFGCISICPRWYYICIHVNISSPLLKTLLSLGCLALPIRLIQMQRIMFNFFCYGVTIKLHILNLNEVNIAQANLLEESCKRNASSNFYICAVLPKSSTFESLPAHNSNPFYN